MKYIVALPTDSSTSFYSNSNNKSINGCSNTTSLTVLKCRYVDYISDTSTRFNYFRDLFYSTSTEAAKQK